MAGTFIVEKRTCNRGKKRERINSGFSDFVCKGRENKQDPDNRKNPAIPVERCLVPVMRRTARDVVRDLSTGSSEKV